MQLSLLDQFSPEPDPSFCTVQRRDLGRGAWLEYVPGWVKGHHQLMHELIATCDWQRHRRGMYDRVVDVPRLVAGAPGSSTSIEWNVAEISVMPSRAPLEEIKRASDRLAQLSAMLGLRYKRTLSQISLGYYRDGRDSVAYHGDKMGPLFTIRSSLSCR